MPAPASRCRHCAAVRCIATISYRKVIVIRETADLSARSAPPNRDESRNARIIPIDLTVPARIVRDERSQRLIKFALADFLLWLPRHVVTATSTLINRYMANKHQQREGEREGHLYVIHIYTACYKRTILLQTRLIAIKRCPTWSPINSRIDSLAVAERSSPRAGLYNENDRNNLTREMHDRESDRLRKPRERLRFPPQTMALSRTSRTSLRDSANYLRSRDRS